MRELRQNTHCLANSREVRRSSLLAVPGFGLLEILIVVALILVLATLYFEGFSSSNYQRRKMAACQDNLQKIFVAMQIYANDSQGKFPATNDARTAEEPLSLLVPRYAADTSIFICPGSKTAPLSAGEPLRQQRISYAYYMGERLTDARAVLMSDQQINTQPKSAGEIVFSETGKPPGNNHYNYGGNFLFNDGSAEPGPVRASFSLAVTQGVVLLNPKP
jgi:prepilin-type N-terminal cleavage/methylation domain-containing protein